MQIKPTHDGFELWLHDRLLLRHSAGHPCVAMGHGTADMAMYRGNFDISDNLDAKIELPFATFDDHLLTFRPCSSAEPKLVLKVCENSLFVVQHDPSWNRFWFRLHAEPCEHVWGCGEQMSYFDLRHRRFPLWTSEPGVGRDKATAITRRADAEGHAGGDYHTTNYPQPTYLSSRIIAVHVETSDYSVFDFTDPGRHELEIWGRVDRIAFFADTSFIGLVGQLSARFGRPPRLPDWIMQGAVIGLKDGARSFERLETIVASGAIVSALWCEDWAGVRQTSFGTRLFWDWRWSAARHPHLPDKIAALRARGIRFMGYANPYLCTDGSLYPLAEALGHLALDQDGATYRVDFGEFDAGIIDFTKPDAVEWFADKVLRDEMLDIGMSGWMADFGEYLPVDAVLAHGSALALHNAWPTIWAEVNARATAGRDDAVFFMRAGFTGVQRYNRLLWAGDQCVDFSRHDGIGTVVTAALSSGLLGNPYHHSDIGGYTSLFGLVRTPELFMRWTEMAAFTPVMRTHEGNRPSDNLQLDQDPTVLAHFARFTRIHQALMPLFASLADEAVQTGLPMQRPLFLHFPDDAESLSIQTAFLLGADLLVAPVLHEGAVISQCHLPRGCRWVHVWSQTQYEGGSAVAVATPIGEPPLFYRAGCENAALFDKLRFI